MTPGKKCAHKACECEVAAGQQYCSRQCEQQSRHLSGDGSMNAGKCECGHAP